MCPEPDLNLIYERSSLLYRKFKAQVEERKVKKVPTGMGATAVLGTGPTQVGPTTWQSLCEVYR